MWVGAPITEIDVGCQLSAVDGEGFHQSTRVGVGAFEVVAGSPGIGIVLPLGEQDLVEILVLRHVELDRVAAADLLEVEGHGRVELAGIA